VENMTSASTAGAADSSESR